MSKPKVSVIVPCYNYARYLRACLDSILAQSMPQLEAIVIDDGSDDDSFAIAQSYAESDPRVRCLRQDNLGSSHAKNQGIRLAQAALIAFLDADDIWLPTKLEKQLVRFADLQVGVVYSRSHYMDPGGTLIPGPERGKRLAPRSGAVTADLLFDNFIPFSSSIVRRELIDTVGGFDENLPIAMDWDLWLKLSLHTRFAYVNEQLMLYRVGHSGQLSHNAELRGRYCDRVVAKFVADRPEWRRLVRRATAYRYAVRAYRMRKDDPSASTRYYREALSLWPFETSAFKGLVRNYLSRYVQLRK